MAQTFGPAESIGRGAVEYQSPNAAAPTDGCGVIAVGADLEFTDSPVATVDYVDEAIEAIELTPGPTGPTGATGPAGPNTISGSTATALLGLLYGNGSNVAIASSANLIAALGYTPVNKAGDSFANLTFVGWNGGLNTNIDTPSGGNIDFGRSTALSAFRVNSGQLGFGDFSGQSLFSSRVSIQPSSATQAGVIVRGQSAQSANLQEWQTSAGSVVASIGVSVAAFLGQLRIGDSAQSYFHSPAGGFTRLTSPSVGSLLTVQGNANNRLNLHDGELFGVRSIANAGAPASGLSPNAYLHINMGSASDPAVYIQRAAGIAIGVRPDGAATQTTYAFSVHGATGAVVAGSVTASGLTRSGVFTVATLPSASANPGFEAVVTDSSVTTNGSPVAGGGSNRVKVFSNGSTWDVVVA